MRNPSPKLKVGFFSFYVVVHSAKKTKSRSSRHSLVPIFSNISPLNSGLWQSEPVCGSTCFHRLSCNVKEGFSRIVVHVQQLQSYLSLLGQLHFLDVCEVFTFSTKFCNFVNPRFFGSIFLVIIVKMLKQPCLNLLFSLVLQLRFSQKSLDVLLNTTNRF